MSTSLENALVWRILRKLEELKSDSIKAPHVDQAKPFALTGFNGLNVEGYGGKRCNNVVVRDTLIADMADHVVIRASHAGLTRHPAAIDQTIAFLRAGRFVPRTRASVLIESEPKL